MQKVLRLIFGTQSAQRDWIIRVPDPRNDITESEIKAWMQELIKNNAVLMPNSYGDRPQTAKRAEIITTQKTSYDYDVE